MNVLEAEVVGFALEAGRVGGVIGLGFSEAPVRVKAGLVLAITFLAHRGPTPLESVGRAALALPFEILVGLAIGLVPRLSLAAVQVAGDFLSPMLGLGIATLFDPHLAAVESAVGRLFRGLATLLAIILGLHRVVIGSVVASFTVLPAGGVSDPGLATQTLVLLSGEAVATGVRLAVPVVGILLALQIALAFVSRAAPSMQIFSVGFAVSLAIGAAVVPLALPDFARELSEDLQSVGLRIDRLVSALGAR